MSRWSMHGREASRWQRSRSLDQTSSQSERFGWKKSIFSWPSSFITTFLLNWVIHCLLLRVIDMAYPVRKPPTSLRKQNVGGYVRQTTSDLLVYNVQAPYKNYLLRIFKQVIWGAIWQLPLERNATDSSGRTEKTDRTDGNDRKNMIDV